jgi:hypothetical protein
MENSFLEIIDQIKSKTEEGKYDLTPYPSMRRKQYVIVRYDVYDFCFQNNVPTYICLYSSLKSTGLQDNELLTLKNFCIRLKEQTFIDTFRRLNIQIALNESKSFDDQKVYQISSDIEIIFDSPSGNFDKLFIYFR